MEQIVSSILSMRFAAVAMSSRGNHLALNAVTMLKQEIGLLMTPKDSSAVRVLFRRVAEGGAVVGTDHMRQNGSTVAQMIFWHLVMHLGEQVFAEHTPPHHESDSSAYDHTRFRFPLCRLQTLKV